MAAPVVAVALAAHGGPRRRADGGRPRWHIAHSGQVEPSFIGAHADDVGHPRLVGTGGRRRVCEQVGRDRFVVTAVDGAGRVTTTPTTLQAVGAHQPGNAVSCAHAAQSAGDARTLVVPPNPKSPRPPPLRPPPTSTRAPSRDNRPAVWQMSPSSPSIRRSRRR